LSHYPPPEVIRRGQRIVRAIGFEAGEERRTHAHVVKVIGLDATEQHRLTWQQPPPTNEKPISRERWLDQNYFVYWYPLMEWGYDRERCKKIIAHAGLPIPVKSACFFCPASKKAEIASLQENHPELLERALQIERNAQAKLTSVKGLGRSFSWQSYLIKRELPLLRGCGS
jgi:hypothetical protein